MSMILFTGEPEGVWAYICRMSRLLFQRIQPYSLTAIISVAFIILAFVSLRFNKGTLSLSISLSLSLTYIHKIFIFSGLFLYR